METELKSFFETNPLALKAAETLKDGREIGLSVSLKTGSTLDFTFARESKKNVLRQEKAKQPDLTFTIPEQSARELIEREFENVGQVGLHIFEKMLSNDPNQKVQAKLHAGVLSLMTGGYLGVLSSGGSEVAKFLATKGLSNMGKLKEAIGKLRG